ncbi:MAG: aryl-sulfate sulfotransferase [Pseudomonadota bacterium]
MDALPLVTRLAAVALAVGLTACEDNDFDIVTATAGTCALPVTSTANDITSTTLEVNPSGRAPLAASLQIDTASAAVARVTVPGANGTQSDAVITTADCARTHTVTVLGLYAGTTNDVTVELINAGEVSASTVIAVTTDPLPDEMPTFRIDQDYATDDQRYFLVNFRPFHRPLIVDRYGDIRWFLDDPEGGVKYGLQILANGNLAYGSRADQVEEYTPLGELANAWTVQPTYEDIHHDVYEMENGNFLVTVNEVGADTVEDIIIELDRSTGEIATVWDLRPLLPRRTTLLDDPGDWFHANAVIHDTRDDSIIVSGQRQGIVKVSRNNELRWILAPPDGWEGFEQFLLTAPLSGEFEYNWGQHAPQVLPDGDLILFDNGLAREYGTAASYSRAVRYRITENDEIGGAVEQVWQYGRERGDEMFSPIISDVDYLPDTGNILITAGALAFDFTWVSPSEFSGMFLDDPEKSRIIEVTEAGEVAFEMVVVSTQPRGSVYRSELVTLFNAR